MKRVLWVSLFVLVAAIPAAAKEGAEPAAAKSKGASKGDTWSMNATAIEACSCPMFCQCYFSTKPAGHAVAADAEHAGHEHGAAGEEHYCRFNNAYKVNKGSYGATKLDGAKFWIRGDLGAEFDDGEMDWAVVTFDKATTKEQREAIGQIVPHLFPVKWKSLNTAEGDIEWVAGKGEAHAKLDGGQTAEVALGTATLNPNTKGEPMVLKNLRYWGAPHNDGFVLMPNTLNTSRAGDNPFEYKGTNGFMITFDIDSKTAPPAPSGGGY